MMKDIHGGNIWEASNQSGTGPLDIMDFSASINPFGPSKRALRAIKENLKLIPPYPDPNSKELIQALSEFYSVPPENILPGNGSTEFIYLLPQVLRPRTALIIEPAFSEYGRALKICGVKTEGLILDENKGFSLDIGRLNARLKRGFDCLILANPANPTGAVMERSVVLEITKLSAKYGARLILDEAFADFSPEDSILPDAAGLKNVIVLRSMTKFFSMAGLRLGFVVSHKNNIKTIRKSMPPWSINTLASIAAAASLKDKRSTARILNWAAREREYMSSSINSFGSLKAYPSAANYLMVRILDKKMSAASLKERLFKKNILIRDLSGFKGLGPCFFRIALKKRAENDLLLDAISSIFAKNHPCTASNKKRKATLA